jgi:hypothetical protein
VRHATQEDLDRVEALLGELRGLSQLRERKRGYFSRGSRAFLHFHEDAGDLYVDVRLDTEFERMRVTSPSEQADFLSRTREALQPGSRHQWQAVLKMAGTPGQDGRRCPIGCVAVGHYESFFSTSAGASAAILGLLVVAVSVVNADDENAATRELRTVLAGSAFLALADIFIISIVALTGGSVVLGGSSLAMAAFGLLATRRLIPRAQRAGNFSRDSRTRTLNIAFASISVAAYTAQLGLALALLANTRSDALQRALVLVLVVLYCSALGRAWVVTGISRRG